MPFKSNCCTFCTTFYNIFFIFDFFYFVQIKIFQLKAFRLVSILPSDRVFRFIVLMTSFIAATCLKWILKKVLLLLTIDWPIKLAASFRNFVRLFLSIHIGDFLITTPSNRNGNSLECDRRVKVICCNVSNVCEIAWSAKINLINECRECEVITRNQKKFCHSFFWRKFLCSFQYTILKMIDNDLKANLLIGCQKVCEIKFKRFFSIHHLF